MAWRHLRGIRVLGALSLLTGSLLFQAGIPAAARAQEVAAPAPALTAPDPQLEANETDTVSILEAEGRGLLGVKLIGDGESTLRVRLSNETPRRLNVVLPPGLVAAATTGQQSMGLGGLNLTDGAFGRDRRPSLSPIRDAAGLPSMPLAPADSGLRSAAANDILDRIAVPAGQTVEITLPAVCLNYGLPTPKPTHGFRLVAAEDYTNNPRFIKALLSLNRVNVGQKIAQAVMWHVANDIPFERMVSMARDRLNPHEVKQAARVGRALDTLPAEALLSQDDLKRAKVHVVVEAKGELAPVAAKLAEDLRGQTLMGLPVEAGVESRLPAADASALLLVIQLAEENGAVKNLVDVRFNHGDGGPWGSLGKIRLGGLDARDDWSGSRVLKSLEGDLARGHVLAREIRVAKGERVFRIENKLPFTVTRVVARAGDALDAPVVTLDELGLSPRRNTAKAVQAPRLIVERVELGGL